MLCPLVSWLASTSGVTLTFLTFPSMQPVAKVYVDANVDESVRVEATESPVSVSDRSYRRENRSNSKSVCTPAWVLEACSGVGMTGRSGRPSPRRRRGGQKACLGQTGGRSAKLNGVPSTSPSAARIFASRGIVSHQGDSRTARDQYPLVQGRVESL